ncbi:MAG: IPT/TIG domain-containing protein [Actinobacteria bacterium]|nr:IPT/TIG domain-containing protein [Actinomycetota bacterium]
MYARKKSFGTGKKSYLLFPFLFFLAGFLIPFTPSYAMAQEPPGWYEQDSGTTVSLAAIEAVDTMTAWVAGAEGTILKTTDGGDDWLPQESGTTLALADISAVDGNTAWAVGGDTVTGAFIVIRTINGGETWETTAEGIGYVLTEIEAVSTDVAWVAGFGVGVSGGLEGIISKTIDGGASWYLQPPGIQSPILDISAVDANTAWAVGGEVVLETIDGGWTWTAQTPLLSPGMDEPETFLAIEAADANNVWLLGKYLYDGGIVSWYVGFFMKSSDGGATWYSPPAGHYGFFTGNDISAADALNAWVAGSSSSSGNLSRTSNGGTTWVVQPASDVDLTGVSAASPMVAWAIGEDGTILHTVSGGFTEPAPQIESISPASGTTGGIDPIQMTITGSDFGASQSSGSAVAFGSWLIVNTDSWSDTEIIFTLGSSILTYAAPGPYEVTVTTPSGTSNAAVFTMLEGELKLDSISPDHGIQHTLLMDVSNLAGSNFKAGSTVRLENESGVIAAISVNVLSPVQIAFSMSLFGVQPGVYDVVVTNPDGSEARLEGGFTVDPLCGTGGGTAVLMLGLTLGLLSLAGSSRLRKRKK